MKAKLVFAIFCFGMSLSSHGALVSRLGGQAYYDTLLDVTWLTDANLAATNRFTNVLGSSVTATGFMNLNTAPTWISLINGLNGGQGHLGVNTWRLPKVSPINGIAINTVDQSNDGSTDAGYNISAPGSAFPGSTASELAHLFYTTLGNSGRFDVAGNFAGCGTNATGTCFTNTGPFENAHTDVAGGGYWADDTGIHFRPGWGLQSPPFVGLSKVILVSTGDVSVIPIPPAFLLLSTGLMGLLVIGRRKS